MPRSSCSTQNHCPRPLHWFVASIRVPICLDGAVCACLHRSQNSRCHRCSDGTFSERKSLEPCRPCRICGLNELVLQPCTYKQDTICVGGSAPRAQNRDATFAADQTLGTTQNASTFLTFNVSSHSSFRLLLFNSSFALQQVHDVTLQAPELPGADDHGGRGAPEVEHRAQHRAGVLRAAGRGHSRADRLRDRHTEAKLHQKEGSRSEECCARMIQKDSRASHIS